MKKNTSEYPQFDKIKIDTNEIEQRKLNISDKSRANLFTWKGQFSPQFVEEILEKYSDSSSIVYDPFVGSGTVLYECIGRNISAIGVELNPSAYYMAKFFEISVLSPSERIEIIDKVRLFFEAVNSEKEFIDKVNRIGAIDDTRYKDILQLVVINTNYSINNFNVENLQKSINQLDKICQTLQYSKKKIDVINGDARKNSIPSQSANLLITSPPYINVFNYHQNYRKSVELLGYDVLNVAKSELGSNRKNRGNRLLSVIQYTIDMALAINESLRVLEENSRMIFIVGRESNVLGNSFSNSEIIYKIFTDIFHLPLELRQCREFKNRFGKIIIEDILHFYSKKNDKDIEEIVRIAREIGVSVLEEKLNNNPQNIEMIASAIEKSQGVKESIFYD